MVMIAVLSGKDPSCLHRSIPDPSKTANVGTLLIWNCFAISDPRELRMSTLRTSAVP